MKISVITISYNSEKTIEQTIKSVLSQKDIDFEYIIVDGKSIDRTMDIIDTYKDTLDRVISEKDGGIYDAMNKGIQKATGDVIAILNSDDVYAHKYVLCDVLKKFKTEQVDMVYGDIAYYATDSDKIVREWKSGEYSMKKLRRGWISPHPACFVKRDVYDKYGLFDTKFDIAGDYEFLLRLFLSDISYVYMRQTLVHMRSGGHSARNIGQRFRGWQELTKAWRKNNIRVPFCLIPIRILSKIKQYFV